MMMVPPPVVLRVQGIEPRARIADPKVEAALKHALDHLAATQEADGGWKASFGPATSITSLSILALMACGHLPGQDGPYRDTLDRALAFVLRHQRPNGLIVASAGNGTMYDHGISTLMLAEVVGMRPDTDGPADNVREALGRAIALILRAQAVAKNTDNDGGWRYQPESTDSDLSVTGWQVMALRAARGAGMPVPSQAIDRAVAYVRRCAVAKGGFAYQPGGGPNNPRTGVGMLALELCGEHGSPEAKAGAAYLADNGPEWASEHFFYEVYYCPQALFQVDENGFRQYQSKLLPILLEHQEADGSWMSPNGDDRTGGRAYCTAMAVLAMAVEYRYLPIYQK
jgi:hypothetical protein